MRKNDVIYALMSALVKCNQGNGAAPHAAKGAASAPEQKYSPMGKASGFDWREEEKVAYEPVDADAGLWGEEEQEQDYGWAGEEEYDGYAPEKKSCYCPPKEKKCHCEPWPWEEKWICTKQSRICCEPIPCEKKRPPCPKNPCHKDPCPWGGRPY